MDTDAQCLLHGGTLSPGRRCANGARQGGGSTIPFTPFHFGPGVFAKGCLPRYFHLTSFVVANVLIDVEVLYYLWRDDRPLHRHLHTYVGGTALGLTAGVLVFAAIQTMRHTLPPRACSPDRCTRTRKSGVLIQSLIAGVIGGVSHVFLDSLMHADTHPLWPFSDHNALIGLIDAGTIRAGCVALGFVGLVLWLLLRGR